MTEQTNISIDARQTILNLGSEIESLAQRISYMVECVENASDHVEPLKGLAMTSMDQMLVFTRIIDETAKLAKEKSTALMDVVLPGPPRAERA